MSGSQVRKPPSPPRYMPPKAAGGLATFLALFGGIWAVVGIVLLLVFSLIGRPIQDDWRLDKDAVQTQAQPLSLKRTASTRGNRRRIYKVHVQFEDSQGRRRDVWLPTTNPAVLEAGRTGAPVHIEYDPNHPERARFVGETASIFGNAIFVPLAFAVIGIALVLVAGVIYATRRAIYRDGQVAEAEVRSVTQTSARINRRSLMRVQYRFRVGTRNFEGRWGTTDPPSVGDTIWVIYHPENPSRNVAVPPSA